MPKLIIDNQAVEVPAGTNVLEAAKQVGVWVPHFCYHPALGNAGACRLCAVMFLEGPVKGLQMSCMIPAQDGMVVSTTDGEAARMRAMVMEWLMINHPHDCPVCGEGGECLLQDYTIAGGHGIRRYSGTKRTHVNQQLGPQIEHEMNRCIQCYRCVRFYQEYAGGTDFGVLGSASKVYFGRFRDGTLESPFSGNLVDLCPTGVFTDKTARFRARYWDYQMAPSLCPHCSLGCNTTPVARYRELLKVTARHNDAVNGWFICDHGRFDNAAVNDPARPRTPLVDSQAVSLNEAVEVLATRLAQIRQQHGPASIALLGSSRASMEANLMLQTLADQLQSEAPCFFPDRASATETSAALALLHKHPVASLAAIQQADCIALLGCDLLQEAPMMALAIRQAWRKGAQVYAVAGSSAGLPFTCTQVADLQEIPFATAKRPVLVCSSGNQAQEPLTELADTVAVALLLNGPNACGAGLLAKHSQTRSLEELLATGTVKALLCLEADLPQKLPSGLQLVARIDWLPGSTDQAVGIFLPSTAWVEMQGTYLNNEGRAQRFLPVMQPGLPLTQSLEGSHPSHSPAKTAPGSIPQPAEQLLASLIEQLGGRPPQPLFTGPWHALQTLDPSGEGHKVTF